MNSADDEREGPRRCVRCQSELGPRQLACPACQTLVYADTLKVLAAEAKAAESNDDKRRAHELWQEALRCLPPETKQYQQIERRALALAEGEDGAPAKPTIGAGSSAGASAGASAPAASTARAREAKPSRFGKVAAAVGAVALLAWKLKFVFAFILTKGKLLLLGLTKGSTFISMFLAFGVYWAVFGWKFALGFVLSIYVHEMGHVAALKRYGIPFSAPMFIPGLGAFVRLRQQIKDPRIDARVGLGGPIGGLFAALFSLGLGASTGWPVALAIARVGGWINLFNLLPVWQLDGGRAFNALTRAQRGWVVAAIAAAWFFSAEGLLLLLLIAGAVRIAGQAVKEGDGWTLWVYCALVAAFAFLATLHVPGLPARRR